MLTIASIVSDRRCGERRASVRGADKRCAHLRVGCGPGPDLESDPDRPRDGAERESDRDRLGEEHRQLRGGPAEPRRRVLRADGQFQRIPQGTAGCAAPCWEYTLENGTSTWEQTSTLRITIRNSSNLATGTTYYVKVVTPNGITDSKFFTV